MDEEDFTQDGSIFMDVPDACYEEYVEDQEELMEELQSSGDYGGMNDETYEGIVQFKKSGSLPEFVVTNEDRNARSHWKMKCMKYELLYDNLIYVNKDVESGGRPRFVVRVGEVLPILTTVHNKIGHLGMKRTQAAVLQCFYWRSVRADVQRFVGTCSFNSGKKVLKAPIDVFGPDVLEVGVRPCVNGEYYGANRFVVKLRGVPDNIALSTRTKLSGYTFKQKHLHVKRGKESTNTKCRQIPLLPVGHSLDGFHEIHSAAAEPLHGIWMGDTDSCKKPRGRRKTFDRAGEQARAAEALNQLSILPPKCLPNMRISAKKPITTTPLPSLQWMREWSPQLKLILVMD
uniref:Integrase zinc-binding domain-containing protein n=1 Tax=Ditylenchus dipsaci TaxID=166011 RepID=A0A915EIT7_9BILA